MHSAKGNLRVRRTALGLATLAVAATLGISGCASNIHTDGQVPDPVRLAKIEPGVHTEDQVTEMLGTPSSVGTFDDHTWYYISKRTSRFAFFDPDVLDQKVVAINFDEQGVVRGIRMYGLEDGTEISPVERTTPTKGKKLTFMDQMIGNMDRISNIGQGGEGGPPKPGGGF